MRFEHDDGELTATVELDDSDPPLDLRDGLGEILLDILCDQMREGYQARRSPSGVGWEPLAVSTVRARAARGVNPDTPGIITGTMEGAIYPGERGIEARSAAWAYPTRSELWNRAHGFHNGNRSRRVPARPFVGWSDTAQRLCRQALDAARSGGRPFDGFGHVPAAPREPEPLIGHVPAPPRFEF